MYFGKKSPPFSDCVPRGQDHLQSLPRSTTTGTLSGNQNHVKLLRFNLSLKWKLKTYISLCELLKPGWNAIVGQRYCSNGWFLVVFMIMAIVTFRETNNCRWFSTYSSFTCLISVLPSQPASATSKIDIDIEMMLKLNGSMQEEWRFSIQRLIGARMCFVCVPPLLKAPLLLADWLPARNLRLSFSFSLKSFISSMDAC